MVGNTNKFVVDASFALAFLLPDERTEEMKQNFFASQIKNIFQQFINGEISLIAPYLLTFEVLNSLKLAVIRKRISARTALNFITASPKPWAIRPGM